MTFTVQPPRVPPSDVHAILMQVELGVIHPEQALVQVRDLLGGWTPVPPPPDAQPARRVPVRSSWAGQPVVSGEPLTDRELQVLRGMAAGHSNARIGRALHLSVDTVKTHGRRLFVKLDAHDRAHAVARGYQRGLLTVGRAA